MLYFSSLLQTTPAYRPAADRLFTVLASLGIAYRLLDGTRDIWLRDFMPVQTRTGKFISFRYTPSYLTDDPKLRTHYKYDVSHQFSFPVRYSAINLDGGNVVFSPSKEKVVISDRVFLENPDWERKALIRTLEQLLEARVLLIPSLKSDMTGHADGMVRFVDENTVLGNHVPSQNGLEQRIKSALKDAGIHVIDFPYYFSPQGSAVGCYLNFLETDNHILLPVFGNRMDDEAIRAAKRLFSKTIVPVNISEIAKDGGVLNCISWETQNRAAQPDDNS